MLCPMGEVPNIRGNMADLAVFFYFLNGKVRRKANRETPQHLTPPEPHNYDLRHTNVMCHQQVRNVMQGASTPSFMEAARSYTEQQWPFPSTVECRLSCHRSYLHHAQPTRPRRQLDKVYKNMVYMWINYHIL